MRKYAVVLLLCFGSFAATARGQTGVISLSVTSAGVSIVTDRSCTYVVIQENSATPSNAFTITLPGNANGVSYAAGTKFLFASGPGGFLKGQTIGTISVASGTVAFVGIESSEQPTVPVATLPNGTVATTQQVGDQSAQVATDSFVIQNGGSTPAGNNGDLQDRNGSVLGASHINDTGSVLNVTEGMNIGGNVLPAGPTPWKDITYPGYGARGSVSISGTATCVSGSGSISLGSAYTFVNGDGVTVEGCGPTTTASAPGAPTVTTGAAEGPETPDMRIAAISGGASTYNYIIVSRTSIGGLTAASSATTITTGPTSLGEQSCAVTSASLSGGVVTFTLPSACAIPNNALFGYHGASGSLNYQRFAVASGGGGTSITANFYQNSAISGAETTTGGSIYWQWGNHITWTPPSGTDLSYVCIERSGAGSYHVAYQTVPGDDGVWNDWGPNFDETTFPLYVSNAICGNASSTPAPLTGVIASGAGTTTIVLANSVTASQNASGNIYRDDVPAVLAAAAASTKGTIYFPPYQTFYINSPLTLATANQLDIQGDIVSHDIITINNAARWSGQTGNSAEQFALSNNPVITCYAAPCVFVNNNSSRIEGINLAQGGPNLPLMVISGNASQITLTNDGFTNASGDYGSPELFVEGGGYQYRFTNLALSGGPGQQGSGYTDASTAPLVYFDGLTAAQPPNDLILDTVNTNGRSTYLADNGGAFYGCTMKGPYNQGAIFTVFSAQNFSGNDGMSCQVDNSTADTSNESIFAVWNNVGTFQGSVSFKGAVTGGSLETGARLSSAIQIGQSFANGAIGSNAAVMSNASLLANDYLDSGRGNAGGYIYNRSYQMFAGPTIQLSGSFTPLLAPALNAFTVSSGGSVPVGTHQYCVWSIGWDGGWSTAGCQSVTTTSGNQTVGMTWNAALGAQGYLAWRDGTIIGTGAILTRALTYTDTVAGETGLPNSTLANVAGDGECGFGYGETLFCPELTIASSNSSYGAHITGTFTGDHTDVLPDVGGTFGLFTAAPTANTLICTGSTTGSMTTSGCPSGTLPSGVAGQQVINNGSGATSYTAQSPSIGLANGGSPISLASAAYTLLCDSATVATGIQDRGKWAVIGTSGSNDLIIPDLAGTGCSGMYGGAANATSSSATVSRQTSDTFNVYGPLSGAPSTAQTTFTLYPGQVASFTPDGSTAYDVHVSYATAAQISALIGPNISLDTTTPVTVSATNRSTYHNNQNATAATAVTYDLPTAAAGIQKCFTNSYNGSAADTGTLELLTSASGQFIIFTDGTLSATGGYVISGGAAADAACVVGIDSTHWQLYVQRGTWTEH